jgi:pilus assembly protein Flp/PilA
MGKKLRQLRNIAALSTFFYVSSVNHYSLSRIAKMELSRRRQSLQSGQGLVEYALVLVMVALVVIAVLTVLGPQVGNVFCNVTGSLGSGPSASCAANSGNSDVNGNCNNGNGNGSGNGNCNNGNGNNGNGNSG